MTPRDVGIICVIGAIALIAILQLLGLVSRSRPRRSAHRSADGGVLPTWAGSPGGDCSDGGGGGDAG